MCEDEIYEINVFNSYPELLPHLKDEHVYNVIMQLHEKQEFTFYQFDTFLLFSRSIEEVKGISRVYSTIFDMIIDYELEQLLFQLDCPYDAMKIMKLAVKKSMENSDNLKMMAKRVYPTIQVQYKLSFSAIGTRLRSAIEIMYLYNQEEINTLCGDYRPIQTGAPTIKVFLQGLANSVKMKQKRVEHQIRCLLQETYVLSGKQN